MKIAPLAGLLTLLALSACAEHEVPFAVFKGHVEAPADLVSLGTAGRIAILLPTGLSDPLAHALAADLAKGLQNDTVPARVVSDQSVPKPLPEGYQVSANATADGVMWTITGPGQQTLYHNVLKGNVSDTASAHAAAEAARTHVEQTIEDDIDRPLKERMAAAPASLSPEEKATIAATDARKAPVSITKIEGLSPKNAALLQAALEAQLPRQGHPIAETAPFVVSARVDISNADTSGNQRLAVHWIIAAKATPDQSLGKVDQANTIPAAAIANDFAAIAVAIAEGAADGIDNAIVQGAAHRAGQGRP
jgi:hypothetical protein